VLTASRGLDGAAAAWGDADDSTRLLAEGLSQLTQGLAKLDRYCASSAHGDHRAPLQPLSGNKRATPELCASLDRARSVVARLCAANRVT